MSEVKPRRGRPPSPAARAAILAAASAILAEAGIGAVTVEAVAARARVGKPTIYRHWPNAQALVMAALIDGAPPVEIASSASPLADLTRQLLRVCAVFASRRGRQAALMVAASEGDSETGKAFRSQVILRSREEGRGLIGRAIATGELRADLDIEVALDLIYGPIFYRLLIGHAPLGPAFVEVLLGQLLAGFVRP